MYCHYFKQTFMVLPGLFLVWTSYAVVQLCSYPVTQLFFNNLYSLIDYSGPLHLAQYTTASPCKTVQSRHLIFSVDPGRHGRMNTPTTTVLGGTDANDQQDRVSQFENWQGEEVIYRLVNIINKFISSNISW